MASEVVLPAHGPAHTHDSDVVWRVELDPHLSQAAVRLQAIRDWCDETEAESQVTCADGCVHCLARKARLECVAQVRALLGGES